MDCEGRPTGRISLQRASRAARIARPRSPAGAEPESPSPSASAGKWIETPISARMASRISRENRACARAEVRPGSASVERQRQRPGGEQRRGGGANELPVGGGQTAVQDSGRYGYQQFGIPVSGALDMFAFRVANILVGNAETSAVLECTFLGPRLRSFLKQLSL